MGKKRGRGRPSLKKKKRYTVEERSQIVAERRMGKTWNQLAKDWNGNEKSMRRIWKKYEETGMVKDKEKPGGPRKTDKREDRHLEITTAKNPKITATEMAKRIAPTFLKNRISRQTVARRLKEFGFNSYVARKKPLLSAANIAKRLEWAKAHRDWSIEDWKKVLFSDETPFLLFQSYGRRFVWRRPGEQFKPDCLASTVKHGGGKIQVWGCFSYWSSGPMYWIKDIMTGPKYREILKHHMAPYMKDVEGKVGIKLTFQHDNDPKHTSKVVKAYLENKKLTVLPWPSQSPDLNPIENAWRKVKLAIGDREHKAKNLSDVFEFAQEEWAKLPLDYFQGLIESLPRRIEAVIKTGGGHTKY
jgi:transposase-like protein